jgi:hypothetical protein
MCVFKNGTFYHYEFTLDGRRHRGSTGTANRDEAVREESRQRERLEKSYSQVIEEEARVQQRKTIQFAANEFHGLPCQTAIGDVRRVRPRACEQVARRPSGGGDYAQGGEAVSSRSPKGESWPEDHHKVKIAAAGQLRASLPYLALRHHLRSAAIPESSLCPRACT